MPEFLSVGTNRGFSMIGTGIGLGVSGFRLPSGGFAPTGISGLKAWWDAADASTLYQTSGGSLASADGDPVGEWRDKSGNGYHWAQASGTSKPALKTGIKNGRNVIRLDGVNDRMAVSGSASTLKLLHSGDSTVFIVFRCSSLAALRVLYDSTGLDTTTIGANTFFYTNGASDTYAARGVSSSYVFLNSMSASYWATSTWYSFRHVGRPSQGTAANRSSVAKNNGTAVTGNTATNALSTSNSTYDLTLGARADTGGSPFVGDFAEIIIYDSALSAGDIALVESYLNAKWGLY